MALQYRGFIRLVSPSRMTRSGVVVVFRAWWPLLVGPPTALCLAVMATAGDVPNDFSAWSLILIDFFTAFTAVLSGLVCAWAISPVVAVPLVAVLWFVWIGYGPASTNTLVHNLDSTFGCCTSDTRPADVAVRATLLLLLVITIGIGCLLASPRMPRCPRPLVAVILTLLLGAGLGAGVGVLHTADKPLNLTATEPRTTSLSCRSLHGLEICLWPENRNQAKTLADVVRELNPRLQSLGLDTVEALTQANRNAHAVSVEAGERLSVQDLRLGVVSGYVDLQSGCRGAVGPARDRAVAFIALHAGLEPDVLEQRFGPSSVAEAQKALSRQHDSRYTDGKWFRADMREIDCVPAR